MTKKEAVIISLYTGVLLSSFSDMHEFAESLMNQSIFTHQFGNKEFVEKMKEKVRPEFMEICNSLSD